MARLNHLAPQCVILVGGRGTRLGALTADCPKPLLDVAGKPFLFRLIDLARERGIHRFLLLAGFRSDLVVEFAHRLAGVIADIEVQVSIEDAPAGTAGAVSNARKKLDEEFLLLNGDSLFLFDWVSLRKIAQNAGVPAAMGLRYESNASRFGEVSLRGELVISFKERGTANGGLINGGVYYFRREAVGMMVGRTSLEHEVLPELARNGVLAGKEYEGPFIDIGVPASFELAQTMFSGLG